MTSSIHQVGTARESRPAWRQTIRARIGADPGRWLDRALVERGPSHTDRTMRRAVHARISGIRSREVLKAWQTVECRLNREACPRQQIIAWLNQRDAALRERGDNPAAFDGGESA